MSGWYQGINDVEDLVLMTLAFGGLTCLLAITILWTVLAFKNMKRKRRTCRVWELRGGERFLIGEYNV